MRVLRYEITDDDAWHVYTLSGPIVRVADRGGMVHIWALADVGTPFTAILRLFATGDEVPDDTTYRGTAVSESGRLVFHLFEQA